MTVERGELFRSADEAGGDVDRARRRSVRGSPRSGRAGIVDDGHHLRPHFADRLVTKLRRVLQGPQHDGIQPHIDLHLARRRLKFPDRQLAREQLVKNHAERVDVRAMIRLRGVRRLLRRHVSRRAQHAVLREARRIRHGSPGSGIEGGAHDPRDAEVRDLYTACLIQQEVLRLDVAMHDAAVVRELQRLADRRHNGQRLRRREAARHHRLSQIDAVDVLHHQKIELAGPSEIMHRDDIRMVEFRKSLSFPREPFGEAGIRRLPWRQNLERHETAERFLASLVDRAHPAATNEFDDLQLGKGRCEVANGRRSPRLIGETVGPGPQCNLLEKACRAEATGNGCCRRRTASRTIGREQLSPS